MIRLAFQSLLFYRRNHAGVLAGTLLASAVLTGALLVGDSVDHSLREFATMRLGRIHFAINSQDRYFSQDLVDELRDRINADIAPVMLLRGMAIRQGETAANRSQVNQVSIIGVDSAFWGFAQAGEKELDTDEVLINRKLAHALSVGSGDEISLRIGKPALLPRDAPLSAREEDRSWRGRFTVREILPDSQLGRFSLSANQVIPYNAFVRLDRLAERVELPNRANVILAGSGTTQEELDRTLKDTWEPEHVGLRLLAHESGVIQLETDRIFLDEETSRAALSIPGGAGTLTYLVNSISNGAVSTPYSFVLAGPIPADLSNEETIINRWLADQLGAGQGDRLTVKYFEFLPSNKLVEKERTFAVHSIREMADLEDERELMPNFPGLSDVERCADWDVGMPMDEDLLKDAANEDYWRQYRQMPKALFTLEAGQEMWGNRFGALTAVRYPASSGTESQVREALAREIDPARTGLFFLPVHAQAENAVSQAMDFGGLFLGMSFFLIVAALLLTGMLFVFGVQQRAREMGTLLALGYTPAQVRRLFILEALGIALIGAVAGAWAGTGYTRALIYGLTRYWPAAVANSAIQYHVEPGTILQGGVISLACALAAMAIASWRQVRRSPRDLLSMDFSQEDWGRSDPRARLTGLAASLVGLLLAVGTILYALTSGVDEVVYPFFLAGSIMLLSGLGFCRQGLIYLAGTALSRKLSLLGLSLQNVARRRGRSLAVIALLAGGSFLVFAVSSMQLDVTANAHEHSSGTGGFSLFAQSTFPILENPVEMLDDPTVECFRIKVRDGDDAGCLNLNYAQNPPLLGVNVEEFASRSAFLPDGKDTTWELLNLDTKDGEVPALVGDADTALWGLRKKTDPEAGDTLMYRDEAGKEIRVKLVGRLPMRLSVFQGALLISDDAFTRLYPSEDGYRMFLVDAPPGKENEVTMGLTREYERHGLDVVPATQRLQEFYAVESAYLAMFLVLGGLGLAVGSAGIGIVVMRNLLERRSELAMLWAVGYETRDILRVLLVEHSVLFVAGVGAGVISAAVSMVPAVFLSDSNVSIPLQAVILLFVVVCSAFCTILALYLGRPRDAFSALRNE